MNLRKGGCEMKSIKPGRGPSMMSGIVGIFMIGFGLLWTALAAQANIVMVLFGLLWTGVAVVTTIYNFKNATKKDRYSAFDITDSHEELDPLNERFGSQEDFTVQGEDADNHFCPYCGTPVSEDFEYCNHCGKKLP